MRGHLEVTENHDSVFLKCYLVKQYESAIKENLLIIIHTPLVIKRYKSIVKNIIALRLIIIRIWNLLTAWIRANQKIMCFFSVFTCKTPDGVVLLYENDQSPKPVSKLI